MRASDRRALKALLDQRVRDLRADDPPRREPRTRTPASLTAAQLGVLRLAALGFGIRETADFLGVSRWTVKSHRREAIARCRATTLTQAVAVAYRRGLLWPRA